jgi:hypothetical protein
MLTVPQLAQNSLARYKECGDGIKFLAIIEVTIGI